MRKIACDLITFSFIKNNSAGAPLAHLTVSEKQKYAYEKRSETKNKNAKIKTKTKKKPVTTAKYPHTHYIILRVIIFTAPNDISNNKRAGVTFDLGTRAHFHSNRFMH